MKPRSKAKHAPVPAKNALTATPSSSSATNNEDDPQTKQLRVYMEQISERLVRVQPKHQKVNESLRAIRSQGARLLGPSSKISQNSKAKLIALYHTAQRQCESEHSTLEQILANVQKARRLRLKQRMSDKLSRGNLMILLAQHATTLPLYIGTIDGHPPQLVGAIPQLSGEPIPMGDFVAAFVEDVWILGEIKSQLSPSKYLVKDIDDDDEEEEGGVVGGGGGEKLLTVAANRLIPLPHHRADPRRHGHALFARGAVVLALYPQTTCFYKGVVEFPPAEPNEDYLIAFYDATFSTGYSPTLPIPQMFVLTHKEVVSPAQNRGGGHRKGSTPSDQNDEDTSE